MISQEIRAFLFVLSVLIVFSSKAFSDDSEPDNSFKEYSNIESILSKSNRSNNVSEKIEETFLGKINFNGIGLIDTERTKFPDDLWSKTKKKILSEKLNTMSRLSLASTNKIFKRY